MTVPPIDWVHIPAGVLQRGTPVDQLDTVVTRYADTGVSAAWFLKEAPRASVPVAAFRIARTPVTVAQWRAFSAETDRAVPAEPDDHPVFGITWADAQAFCSWMTERVGYEVRLPTETEWERAARGDDVREFPWGDQYRTGLANLWDLGVGTTTPVGSFPAGASPFGVLDMAGNVDEWTSTLYAPYPGAPAEVSALESWAFDPHITRGGAFRHDRDLARCARRHGAYEEDLRAIGVGFRLAADSG
ncbi:formylglycine-generating enzyme family protein [Microbacterium sp. KUDC0406]|uniref:formylglycine-generating enzyme family protein n=1 Tax=Microbacterium sp. KUDC0406 TaxID=2909588 RepID=UPI001F372D18|nr:SUMF1/EgtB/PvdO family nonheme iron enzyme [Microbacterium sp. KUDC0406]UJP09407.1 formylglycine-generating enzyme family protein [Microbacterium sp. KUDC0406]